MNLINTPMQTIMKEAEKHWECLHNLANMKILTWINMWLGNISKVNTSGIVLSKKKSINLHQLIPCFFRNFNEKLVIDLSNHGKTHNAPLWGMLHEQRTYKESCNYNKIKSYKTHSLQTDIIWRMKQKQEPGNTRLLLRRKSFGNKIII